MGSFWGQRELTSNLSVVQGPGLRGHPEAQKCNQDPISSEAQ